MGHVGITGALELRKDQVTCPLVVLLSAYLSLFIKPTYSESYTHTMVGQAEGEGQETLYIRRTRIVASRHHDPKKLHDISIKSGSLCGITEHRESIDTQGLNEPVAIDADSHLMTPSLCHAHVHLDKAFLMSDPKYADLRLEKGGFAEAMEIGTKAKKRFEMEDLLRRGRW